MHASRRLGREAALQKLYLMDVCGLRLEDIPDATWERQSLEPGTRAFAEHLASGVHDYQGTIDSLIVKYAANWELKRMASIDRCILRLAAFELLVDIETPVKVIINEALEIVKKYSQADSSKFVNGILDKIKQERKQSTVDRVQNS